jgi:hypothetical protein
MEIWKDIESIDGYRVSNFGRVKSLKYNRETILKPSKTKNGYNIVKIGNPQKNRYIHLLVVKAFLNHDANKDRTIVCDHKDNNKDNNNLENLQIITNRENTIKDRHNKTGYKGVRKSSKNRWEARVTIDKKRIKIGHFNSPEEAHNAIKNYIKNDNTKPTI